MRSNIKFWLPLIVLMVSKISQATQIVAFNSFGENDYFDAAYRSGIYYNRYPDNTDTDYSCSFMPTESIFLNTIMLAITFDFGSNELDIWLLEDDNGSPGNTIEALHVSNGMGGPQYPPVRLPVAISDSNPLLHKDSSYWIAVSASGPLPTQAGWHRNSEYIYGLTAFRLNGVWMPSSNKLIGAFRIEGESIPESTAPIADAGSDQTVMDADDNGSEEITLDGSGSTDSDGTIQSYVWSEVGTQIATGVNPNITLSIGQHTITLTVTDDDGLTDTDTVTITVEALSNQPPIADADGPYAIYVGDTLTLDASGSTDYDNDIVSYLWDLDDNNSFETDAGSQAVFGVNYAYLQSLGLLVNNTYNIHLKVTDSVGQSDINDSTLTILPTPALQVLVDIKPGSCPNPLNVKSSGVLPVAILGTADFDITTIDPTSIRLAGVSPLRSSFEDVAGPVADSNDCNCTEDGPDGFLDLTLKFKTQKIVEAIGDVNEGDVLTLELTGVLIGERPIEGADCVLIVGKHKPCNKFDVNKDGVVDSQDFAIFAENWLQSSIVDD